MAEAPRIKIDTKQFVHTNRQMPEQYLLKLAMKKAGLTENEGSSMEDNISKPDKETIIQDLMEGSNLPASKRKLLLQLSLVILMGM